MELGERDPRRGSAARRCCDVRRASLRTGPGDRAPLDVMCLRSIGGNAADDELGAGQQRRDSLWFAIVVVAGNRFARGSKDTTTSNYVRFSGLRTSGPVTMTLTYMRILLAFCHFVLKLSLESAAASASVLAHRWSIDTSPGPESSLSLLTLTESRRNRGSPKPTKRCLEILYSARAPPSSSASTGWLSKIVARVVSCFSCGASGKNKR